MSAPIPRTTNENESAPIVPSPRVPWRHSTLRIAAALLFTVLLAACGQSPSPEGVAPDAGEVVEMHSVRVHSLRGNTSFSASSLPSEARLWYDRLWANLRNTNASTNYATLARSGNLYEYARPLNSYLTTLMTAFRVTGDLRMLDEMDRHMQAMRGTLRTTWVDSNGNAVTPNDGTRGLRRWNYMRGSGSAFGRDTHVMDSVMTHALVANVAYAYEMNRGLKSPAGVNYGERADFWKNYLKNDFEKIWQIRSSNRTPYWNHQVSHSYRSQVRWYYYMGRLFGEARYRDQAVKMANEFKRFEPDVSTSYGTAKVFSHRVLDTAYGLQPITYAAYDYMILSDLALDGFSPVGGDYMTRHANAVAVYVMDNGTKDFSFDVGGMRTRGGIRTRNPWDASSLTYARQNATRFANSPFTTLAAFDRGTKIRTTSEGVYRALESNPATPKRPFIPAGMLIRALH